MIAGIGGWHLRGGLATAPVAASPTRMVSGASPSRIDLGDNELDLGVGSAIVAAGDDDHGIVLVVERGSVTCTVAPRLGRPPFVVQAGEARVRVVGTRFTVERLGEGARVDVDHGVVEVSAGSDRVTLRDGQAWTTPFAVAPVAPVRRSRRSRRRPVGLPGRPRPRRAGGGRLHGDGGRRGWAAGQRQAAGAFAARAASRPPPRASRRGRRTRRARWPSTGSSPRPGASWGANALFAEARLEAERGRREEAQVLAAQYLSRFPGGPNASDARLLVGGN